MKYIVENINKIKLNNNVPNYFIKNKYSKYEYTLLKKYLKKFYNINTFKVSYTKNGKPLLDNNIHISITTSNDLIGIAFSDKPIGIDIEFITEIKPKVKRFLNIPENISNQAALLNFCSREAIIKLEGLTLKDINNINTKKYKIYSEIIDDYILVISEKKEGD